MATVGAGPSRMRGVCDVSETALNGDGGPPATHASQVPRAARYRLSQPLGVPFTSGVAVSM